MSEHQARCHLEMPYARLHTSTGGYAVRRRAIHALEQAKRGGPIRRMARRGGLAIGIAREWETPSLCGGLSSSDGCGRPRKERVSNCPNDGIPLGLGSRDGAAFGVRLAALPRNPWGPPRHAEASV
jgi:hypothetical protein